MKKVSQEVHRRGIVRISYDQVGAMKPATAALQKGGWDIRYKVDDTKKTFEIYLEHQDFDESDEYIEYELNINGEVDRVYRLFPT